VSQSRFQTLFQTGNDGSTALDRLNERKVTIARLHSVQVQLYALASESHHDEIGGPESYLIKLGREISPHHVVRVVLQSWSTNLTPKIPALCVISRHLGIVVMAVLPCTKTEEETLWQWV
jgi:hypothetical protein